MWHRNVWNVKPTRLIFFSSLYWSNATAEMELCGAAWCLMTNGICILDKTMVYGRDWSERRMYSTTMTSARQESENQRKIENLHSISKCEIFYFHYQSLHCSQPSWVNVTMDCFTRFVSGSDRLWATREEKNSDDDSMKRKICTSFRWASPSISHQLKTKADQSTRARADPVQSSQFFTYSKSTRWNH